MNSIFQDPQLLNTFFEIVKKGQEAASVAPPDVQGLARKLILNLSRNMEGGLSTITSEAGTATSAISIPTLSNLNSLLKHLVDTKIVVDGKRVAYVESEYGPLDESEKRLLSTMTGDTLREADNRMVGVDYFVNVPMLVDYLQHLQARGMKDEETGQVQRGKLLQVMTNNLLQKVKRAEPEAEITPPKAAPPKIAPLSDETKVDSFGIKIFDERNPFEEAGIPPLSEGLPLTLKDLKSYAALDAWLRQAPVSYTVSYDAQGKRAAHEYGTEGSNPCTIIASLYKRSTERQRQATTPEEKQAATAYAQRVQDLGPAFTGPDGKPCTVEVTAVEPVKTEEPVGEKAIEVSIFESLRRLPLESGRLNFNKIREFFEAVRILPAISKGAAMTNMAQAEESMKATSNLTTAGETIFNLGTPIPQLMEMLKDPQTGQKSRLPGRHFWMLLQALYQVLNNIHQVIEYFYSSYPEIINKRGGKELILNQIGRTPSDDSLYQQNFRALSEWRSQVTARA